jgi:hypothetical protein
LLMCAFREDVPNMVADICREVGETNLT